MRNFPYYAPLEERGGFIWPFVGGLLVGGLFAPPKGGFAYQQPPMMPPSGMQTPPPPLYYQPYQPPAYYQPYPLPYDPQTNVTVNEYNVDQSTVAPTPGYGPYVS